MFGTVLDGISRSIRLRGIDASYPHIVDVSHQLNVGISPITEHMAVVLFSGEADKERES
jgi:hypothetical protein